MNTVNDRSNECPTSKQANQSLDASSPKQESFRSRTLSGKKRFLKRRTNSLKNCLEFVSGALPAKTDSLIQFCEQRHDPFSAKHKFNQQQDVVTINVSGNRYQTYLSTLEKYPNTLLGNKYKRMRYWNERKNEFFFDRHRACFGAILYYYQSNGQLRRPDYIPLDTFLQEVSFFDLGEQAVSQIDKLENVSIIQYIDLPNSPWRRHIWFYLEYPEHSRLGRILYLLSMLLTLLSCIALAVETLPKYTQQSKESCKNEENMTEPINDSLMCSINAPVPLFIIQTICVSYFTIEFILRLISTPSYYKFVISPFTWIDLCAIVPYFILLSYHVNRDENTSGVLVTGLRVLQMLRFLRILKIYLIFIELKSLRVLNSALKESYIDFIIMITVLTVVGFLFGIGAYFAEQDANGDIFDSIPRTAYWGVITVTTVGYGDMHPITVIGRILAVICAYFGVTTSAMLVSVLVDRYKRVYNRKQFFPEHIISTADLSDRERDDKHDFLRRNLSESKRFGSSRPIIPPTPELPIRSMTLNERSHQSNTSPLHIRFIISVTENRTHNGSMHKVTDELMAELTEAVKYSEDQIYLKLIRGKNIPPLSKC